MNKLANQWIELFRTGTPGDEGAFTNADLDQIVDNYRPSQPNYEEAPITIGHPTGPAPAWGWWESLKRVGDTLLGKPKDVQPEFEDMVERKLFKKRSVGLVKRDNGWTLNHVAFLGAKAPAIKGLKDCEFTNMDKVIEVAFEESEEESVMAEQDQKGIIAGINEWLEKRFAGFAPVATAAAATFTEADVKRIAGEASVAAVEAAVKPLQKQLDDQKTTFVETQTKAATAETQQRARAAIDRLKAKGSWVPAFEKQGLPEVFSELAKVTETVEFGEGDKKVKKTPLEIFAEFMEGLGKLVPTERLTAPINEAKAAATVRQFSAPVDPNSTRFATLATELAAKEKITFEEAMGKVAVAHPELTRPGASTGGAV